MVDEGTAEVAYRDADGVVVIYHLVRDAAAALPPVPGLLDVGAVIPTGAAP
jgi:hypothetical protein